MVRLIVAGNLQQYKSYLREAGETPATAKFVHCSEHIRGYAMETPVILYGEHWLNPVSKSGELARFNNVKVFRERLPVLSETELRSNSRHMIYGLVRRHLMGAIYGVVRNQPVEVVKSIWALVCMVDDLDERPPERGRVMPEEVRAWIEGQNGQHQSA